MRLSIAKLPSSETDLECTDRQSQTGWKDRIPLSYRATTFHNVVAKIFGGMDLLLTVILHFTQKVPHSSIADLHIHDLDSATCAGPTLGPGSLYTEQNRDETWPRVLILHAARNTQRRTLMGKTCVKIIGPKANPPDERTNYHELKIASDQFMLPSTCVDEH